MILQLAESLCRGTSSYPAFVLLVRVVGFRTNSGRIIIKQEWTPPLRCVIWHLPNEMACVHSYPHRYLPALKKMRLHKRWESANAVDTWSRMNGDNDGFFMLASGSPCFLYERDCNACVGVKEKPVGSHMHIMPHYIDPTFKSFNVWVSISTTVLVYLSQVRLPKCSRKHLDRLQKYYRSTAFWRRYVTTLPVCWKCSCFSGFCRCDDAPGRVDSSAFSPCNLPIRS